MKQGCPEEGSTKNTWEQREGVTRTFWEGMMNPAQKTFVKGREILIPQLIRKRKAGRRLGLTLKRGVESGSAEVNLESGKVIRRHRNESNKRMELNHTHTLRDH